jgi:hypothetical protein
MGACYELEEVVYLYLEVNGRAEPEGVAALLL